VRRAVTPQQMESLRVMETNLPMTPDSIVALYKHYDPNTFHTTYKAYLLQAAHIIDSLNQGLPDSLRIDTLAIDHSFENIGVAARIGRSIYISSSYFYLYNDTVIIRSILFHEFGHSYYYLLDKLQLQRLVDIWLDLHDPPAFYLFRDREYSHNSRFGGHPDESPAELFASAFNLLFNNPTSISNRAWLLPENQRPMLDRITGLLNELISQRNGSSR
jgi:hypothetical protein